MPVQSIQMKLAKANLCLHRLTIFVFTLLRFLSRLNKEETLKPAPNGLMMLYLIVANLISNNGREDEPDPYWRTYPWDGHVCTISRDGGRRVVERPIAGANQVILELFSGSPCLHSPKSASAVSHGGICIVLPALEDPLGSSLEQIRIRVLPGKINFRDRVYTTVMGYQIDKSARSLDSLAAAHC